MTRVRSKSEEKRALILSAATKLFSEQGFSNTSMDQIAKEAGVSKQTVYSHFGNKDELFIESISSNCVSCLVVDLVSDKLDNPEQALLVIARNFISMLLSQDAVDMHRTCVAESISYPHVSRLFYEAGPQKMIGELNKVMAEFNRRGLLDIPDTHFAAVQFLSAMKGEICMQIEYNVEEVLTETQNNAYIENTVAMFLRAYQPY